jgi:mannosyltransferase
MAPRQADRLRAIVLSPTVLAVGAITVLGFVLRVLHLGESLAGDEILSFVDIHDRSLPEAVDELITNDIEYHPPLYFVLAWGSIKLGDPSVLIRLPSLIGGTAAIPVLYLLGAQSVGKRAGLLAAAMLALSPFAVFFSVEARPYGLEICLVSLSTLALLRAIDGGRTAWWVVYGCASCAVLYTHYFGVFVVVVQGGWALWALRDRMRTPIIVHAAIAAAYLPWIPAMLEQGRYYIPFLVFTKPLSAESTGRELFTMFAGDEVAPPSSLPGRTPTTILLIALAVALCAALVQLLRRRRGTGSVNPPPRVILLVLLALATPLGFLVYSITGPEIMVARYMIASLPALLLVAAALVSSLPRALALTVSTIVIGVLAVGTVMALESDRRRTPYEEIANYIDANAGPDGAVVFTGGALGFSTLHVTQRGVPDALAIYLEGDHRFVLLTERGRRAEATLARAARGRRRMLVVGSRQPTPPEVMSARLVGRKVFSGPLPYVVQTYEPRTGRTFRVRSIPAVVDPAERAVVERVTGCLRRAGFAPRRVSSPAGSAAFRFSGGGGGDAFFYLYRSLPEARAAVPGIRTAFQRLGRSQVSRVDDSVITYLGRPAPDAASRIEPCAERSSPTAARRRDRAARLVGGRARGQLVLPGGRRLGLVPGAIDGVLEGSKGEWRALTVTGWAVDRARGRAVDRVFVFADGELVMSGRLSVERPDVAKTLERPPRFLGYRLTGALDHADRLAGSSRIRVVAVSGTRASELPRVPGSDDG